MLRAALSLVMVFASTAAAAPGATFVRANGVFKIDDAGKVTRIVPDEDLPSSLTVDGDGDVWVSSIGGKVTGFKAKKVSVQLPNKDKTARYPIAMVAAKGGGIWALGRENLFRISAKGKLEKFPAPVARILGPGAMVEVGDVIWVATDYGVHKFAGKTWEAARPERHDLIARDTNNVVWSVHHLKDERAELVGFDGAKWTQVAIEGEGIAAIAPGKEGRLYVMTWGKGWKESRIDVLAGGKWTVKKFGGLDGLRQLVVDDAERIWTRQDEALLVLGKDGKSLAKLPPGSVPALLGNIADIVIAGAGPTTLPVAGAVATGTVVGRFMKSAKEPLANTKLTVCVGSCLDASPKFEIVTDADGKFKVADVAALDYTSIKLGNTIHSITNFVLAGGDPKGAAKQLACCLAITAGKVLDVGTLRGATELK